MSSDKLYQTLNMGGVKWGGGGGGGWTFMAADCLMCTIPSYEVSLWRTKLFGKN